MMRVLSLVVLLSAVATTAAAQGTSDFTVQVFGGSDTTPPSTPTISSVVPVTTSQINVAWSTSTDNFAVFGYVVTRDGIDIATTTLASFIDSGLSASTTYSYEVRAFDGVPNYSTSSAVVATTTLDNVVTPPTTSTTTSTGAGGTQSRVISDSVSISVGTATATVELRTRDVARIEVRIGTTSSYDQQYIVGNDFKVFHEVFVGDLRSKTEYRYEIIGYTPSGGQTVLRRGVFTTRDDSLPIPPSNVTELSAVQSGDTVRLSYKLPATFQNNERIRVVRSHIGFPQFLSDGIVIYEGTDTELVDTAAFVTEDTAFYTVFVIDENGLVSSGAVVWLTKRQAPTGVTTPVVSGPSSVNPRPDPSATTTLPDDLYQPQPTSTITDAVGFPELHDFILSQEPISYPFSSTTISLDNNRPFSVSVSEDVISGDFKTIVVTLSDPRDPTKQFSFLLRRQGEQSTYSAVIAPLYMSGRSTLTVEVFDFDTTVINRYQTSIRFTEVTNNSSSTPAVWYWRIQTWLWALLLVVPIGVLVLLFYIYRRPETG